MKLLAATSCGKTVFRKQALLCIVRRCLVMLCLFIGLSGCGFALRSSPVMYANNTATSPNDTETTKASIRLYMPTTAALKQDYVFAKQLENALFQTFTEGSSANNSMTLRINALKTTYFTVALNYNNEATRQEVTATYRFSLHQNDTITNKKITIKRFVNLNPNNPNHTKIELKLIKQEMHKEATQRIIQQIRHQAQ